MADENRVRLGMAVGRDHDLRIVLPLFSSSRRDLPTYLLLVISNVAVVSF